MFRKLSAVAAMSLAFAMGGEAQATTINLSSSSYGIWQAFDVDDFVSTGNPAAWIDSNIVSPGYGTALNFTTSGPVLLRVVDTGFAGDVFDVFDNGVSLGQTSAAQDTTGGFAYGTTQSDFNAAFGDVRFSRGTFLLGAGLHSITGLVFSNTSGFLATSGGVQVSSIPVPPAIVGFVSGFGLLLGALRRRQSNTRQA